MLIQLSTRNLTSPIAPDVNYFDISGTKLPKTALSAFSSLASLGTDRWYVVELVTAAAVLEQISAPRSLLDSKNCKTESLDTHDSMPSSHSALRNITLSRRSNSSLVIGMIEFMERAIAWPVQNHHAQNNFKCVQKTNDRVKTAWSNRGRGNDPPACTWLCLQKTKTVKTQI